MAVSKTVGEELQEQSVFTSVQPPISSPPAIQTPLRPRFQSPALANLNPVNHDAISSLLAPLSINLSYSPSQLSIDVPASLSTLGCAIDHRTRIASDQSLADQQSFETAIATHLIDAQTALQLLHDSVLADNGGFGSAPAPGLIDPEIEASLTVLGGEIASAAARVQRAERDMDRGMLVDSQRRDWFVKKWT